MTMMTLRSTPKRRIRELWTTGQIAALIGVNVKTATHWIDSGQIRGVTMPGIPDRRVHRSALRTFLNRHGFYWSIAKLDHEEGAITSGQLEAILRGESAAADLPRAVGDVPRPGPRPASRPPHRPTAGAVPAAGGRPKPATGRNGRVIS